MIDFEDATGALSDKEQAHVRRAAKAALTHAGVRGRLSIFAVDGARMREVNSAHRGIDGVTDVLSFPTAARGECPIDGYYGDILLCPARAREQAERYGHGLDRELAFLTIHGVLHLLGYDHETPDDERCMRHMQTTILERMGLSQ